MTHHPRIAVIGLGYVGLPVALALARRYPGTVGFDVDAAKVAELRRGHDRTGELDPAAFEGSGLRVTDDPADLGEADFFVVAVPTPVDASKRPDLSPLLAATRTVGGALRRGAIVVYESTVYPGVTEEICGPLLAECSGLRCGVDFKLGYSPERINPGDREHTLDRVVKVVSAQDAEALEDVAAVYGSIVAAGVHRASSIKVAEACKVIENVQRDLNIALMNELAVIFDRLGIDTSEVLAASSTKWNFLRFTPGLVGGHCIGVDPYYLTTKAQELGITPQVILAGRRINDSMGEFVARNTIKALGRAGRRLHGARVAVLGLSFKEDVRDIRNSRVPDIVAELAEFGARALVHDPLALPAEAQDHYGIELVGLDALHDLDAVVLAVPHAGLAELALELLRRGAPVFVDVKAKVPPERVPPGVTCWRL
jgi:UDP-N-acetyl-D-galactosamine dehydrogenase